MAQGQDGKALGWVPQLNEICWVWLPARAGRFSFALCAAMTDGTYLTAFPVVGALIQPLALLVGLYLGSVQVGYDPPGALHYLYSPLTVLVFVMLSQHGVGIGVALWLGYAVGDLMLYVHPSGRFFPILAARLLADTVLALLVIAIPLAVRRLSQLAMPLVGRLVAAVSGRGRVNVPGDAQLAIAIVLHALVACVLVYLWMQTAGLLLQGVYKWSGNGPLTHGLVVSLHRSGLLPSIVAAYIAGVRAALEFATAANHELAARHMSVGRMLSVSAGHFRLMNRFLGGLFKAALLTFMMGSLLLSWSEAIRLFAIFAATFIARQLAPRFLPAWPRLFSRIPVVVRCVIALAIVYVGANHLVQATWNQDNTFFPAMAAVTLALIIFAVALPARGWSGPVASAKGPAVAVLLLCAVAIPGIAFAGNCTSVPNCFGDPYWSKLFLTGLGVLAALLVPDLDTGNVQIVVPDDLTIQTCGQDVVFRAETDPPGREAEIQWEVPQGQFQAASSGTGPEFTTSWTETGVKQVVAKLDDAADDVILFVYKTKTGEATLADILDAAPPPVKRGPEDYQTYRQHDIPTDDADTEDVEG